MCALRYHAFLLVLFLSYGHSDNSTNDTSAFDKSLHNEFSEKIGNFSIELLYRTSKDQESHGNLVISPMTVWTVMSLIAEGAGDDTFLQIKYALRINNTAEIRKSFQSISKWLQVHSDTVELEKLNAIFMNKDKLLLRDFQEVAKKYYDTDVVPLNYTENVESLADGINKAISKFTHGKVPQLVDSNAFSEAEMFITSALYFKGQWSVPFNVSSTTIRPFYDSNGKKIGEVNMMYNRHNYPFANIKELQARIIELSYGLQNRLSILIMLPYPNVTVEDMFLNFKKLPLDTIFEELRIARDDYGEDEVDCLIPRFKIESNLILTDVLKSFGIVDLFDSSKARLPRLARTPLYVTKVIHKAQIEVTEEGTTATGVTAAEFANRIGIARFEGNRPFSYVIVEKVTNSIVFGGFYKEPSLY